MRLFRIRCAALALALSSTTAYGGAEDFRFELVSTDHRVGSGAIVEVSLTDLRTGTPVEGAVIFATRMDMAPDGMETMTSPVTAMPAETWATTALRQISPWPVAGGFRLPPRCRAKRRRSKLRSI